MSVITISRQMGSQGFLVGQELARLLNYRLVWRDLINQAAVRSGAPEVALAMIDELGLLGLCPSAKKCQAYIDAVHSVLFELASEGNVVIVGRGGQIELRDYPKSLHVRIIAPLDLRIQRISVDKKVTAEAALAQLEASDRYRRNYFHRFYQTDWDDPSLYDLTINTAHIQPLAAAKMIGTALDILLQPTL